MSDLTITTPSSATLTADTSNGSTDDGIFVAPDGAGEGVKLTMNDQAEEMAAAAEGFDSETEESAVPTHRLKINGKEYDVPQDKVLEMARMYGATAERLAKEREHIAVERQAIERAKQYEATVEGFVTQLQKSAPDKQAVMLESLGVNLEALAIGYVEKLLEWNALPDVEKKRIALEQRERAFNEQEAARRQAQESQVLSAAQERAGTMIAGAMPSAMEAAGLPKTEVVGARMAMVWEQAIATRALPEPTTQQEYNQQAIMVAKHVRQQLEREKVSMVNQLPADALFDQLTNDQKRALQQKLLRQNPVAKRDKVQSTRAAPKSNEVKYVSPSEFAQKFKL